MFNIIISFFLSSSVATASWRGVICENILLPKLASMDEFASTSVITFGKLRQLAPSGFRRVGGQLYFDLVGDTHLFRGLMLSQSELALIRKNGIANEKSFFSGQYFTDKGSQVLYYATNPGRPTLEQRYRDDDEVVMVVIEVDLEAIPAGLIVRDENRTSNYILKPNYVLSPQYIKNIFVIIPEAEGRAHLRRLR